jgi:hypothetical protein
MERKRIPLREIVPDQRMIDRLMHGAQIDNGIRQPRHDDDSPQILPEQELVDFGNDPEIVYARTIFASASEVKRAARVRGALYPVVTGALEDAVADWQEKFPNITHQEVIEIIKFSSFSKAEARAAILETHGVRGTDYSRLALRHVFHAAKALKTYQAQLMVQQIPSGLLDAPSYEPQRTVLGCMPGCYSMIFKAIAGDSFKAPSQFAMTSLSEHGGTMFDEDVLFQSLSTALFRKTTGHLVTSRVLIGADFDDITRRANQVKQRIPDAKVYATVGLKNFAAGLENGLHGVVLLNIGEDMVTFHNPFPRQHHRNSDCTKSNADNCGAFDSIDKAEFIERWSASLHDTRLIISRPEHITS